VNQVLATAALLDGLQVRSLDQTGMSQKAGPVASHLRIARDEIEPSNRIGVGQSDCYLALDFLTGSEVRNLVYAEPGRTAAYVSTSEVPTGAMVEGSAGLSFPPREQLLQRLRPSVRDLFDLDTFAAANALFGNTTPCHFLLVGAAFQAGALPISAAAIEAALDTLTERCRDRGIRVQRGNGLVQLISAPEFGPYVERFLGAQAGAEALRRGAIETIPDGACRCPETRSWC